MMLLVIGGSASGKSAYAEDAAAALSCEKQTERYYLATMQVSDEEDLRRVKNHRMQRKEKGFITIEQPRAIHRSLENMKPGKHTVLLECISNLAANEMFSGEMPKPEDLVVRRILSGISVLHKELMDLVIVSNNVFEDGNLYSDTTKQYIRALGMINRTLASMADKVVELVAGIPIIVKPQEEIRGEGSSCVY